VTLKDTSEKASSGTGCNSKKLQLQSGELVEEELEEVPVDDLDKKVVTVHNNDE
jgi:hypothetical protein